MRVSDVTFLSDLWVASWREAMPDIDFDGRRTCLADLLGDRAHATLVAEVGGNAVGFVTVEDAYLHQLVVAPAVKGAVTASRLLAAAKARVGPVRRLDVNQGNLRAVWFYSRENFRIETQGINPASQLPT